MIFRLPVEIIYPNLNPVEIYLAQRRSVIVRLPKVIAVMVNALRPSGVYEIPPVTIGAHSEDIIKQMSSESDGSNSSICLEDREVKRTHLCILKDWPQSLYSPEVKAKS
jgi:hypothetical protein